MRSARPITRRVALEVQVVQRQHARAVPAERQRVLEVRELGPEAAQQPRQRPGHPRLLEARGQLDRLDALRHEVGTPRHGGEREVGRDERAAARSRLSTYVSSPVRLRPSTSASTTITRPPRRRPVSLAPPSAQLGAATRGRARTHARCRRGSTSTSVRVDERGVVAGELGHRRAGARHDRAAAGERLGDRDAEALVERGVDEAARAAVERRELLVAHDLAEPRDVRAAASTSPQPRAPTTRSSPSTACAMRGRFLRGSSVPTAST